VRSASARVDLGKGKRKKEDFCEERTENSEKIP
jgi:hypothetical protein